MHRRGWFSLLAGAASCAPAGSSVPLPAHEAELGYLVTRRGTQLESRRVGDTATPIRRDGMDVHTFFVGLDEPDELEMGASLDPSRAEELQLEDADGSKTETCGARGVVRDPSSGEPVIDVDPRALGADVFRLEGEAWVEESSWPSALDRVALRVPVTASCGLRRWVGEPFGATSPVLHGGLSVRGTQLAFDFPPTAWIIEAWPTSEDDFVFVSPVITFELGRGESFDPSRAIVASDLGPIPEAWYQGKTFEGELRWIFTAVRPAGTSSTGEARFLISASPRVGPTYDDQLSFGAIVVEAHFGPNRARLGRTLWSEEVRREVPLVGLRTLASGGFVTMGGERMIYQATPQAPVLAWETSWIVWHVGLTSVAEAQLVAFHTNGEIWVGDPSRGPEGLRREESENGAARCRRLVERQVDGETRLYAFCGDDALLERRNGRWQRRNVWLPLDARCADPVPVCGRGTWRPGGTPEALVPLGARELLVPQNACPTMMRIDLGTNTCAETNVFELEALVDPPTSGGSIRVLSAQPTADGLLVGGNGGLLAIVRPTD